MFSEFCSISALSCSFEFVWWVWVGGWVGGIPSDYLVSTQLQLWLFCWLWLWLLLGCDNYLLDPIFLTHLYHIVCLIYWVLWCLCYLRQLIKQQRLITCQINMNLWRMYQRCHCFSFKWNDFFKIQFWFQCQYNVLSNVIVINIKKKH